MKEHNEQLIERTSSGLKAIADAITPFVGAPGKDASGTYVASLTEALMGITSGLVMIAESIGDLAEAVRERNTDSQ